MAKKAKPRCKNCGDETTFPANADMERSKKGWCVPCYRVWRKEGPGRNPENKDLLKDEAWKERSLYDRKPFDGRAIEGE